MKLFKTGLTDFDRVLGGGFVSGSVVSVCGKIGSGKSAFLTHCALRFAEQGANVTFFTPNKTRSVLHTIAAAARASKSRVVTRTSITDDEMTRAMYYLRRFSRSKGDIDFSTLIPPRVWGNVAFTIFSDVVIFDVPMPVDVLEILSGEGKFVIAVCDMTENERAIDQRPRLPDLPRDIASSSDVVVGIHKVEDFGTSDRIDIELIVVKGRDTGVGTASAVLQVASGSIHEKVLPLVGVEDEICGEPDKSKHFVRDAIALLNERES